MEYFKRVGLIREPFSNSPDPRFLYDSTQHRDCIQQLEISVRLKRGLNVVIGDVGTGKTTLCRRFLANIGREENISCHLLLDPYFKNPKAFLRLLVTMLTGRKPKEEVQSWALKERVKKELFSRGVEGNTLTVLIIDEAQKITPACLELLRELLNYETNSEKLLQIVLLGQKELEPKIDSMPNFRDRISFFFFLKPLGFRETLGMIRHRLSLASPAGRDAAGILTALACYRIYLATGGYPRKIVMLCHKVILGMIIRDADKAGWRLVAQVLKESRGSMKNRVPALAAAVVLLAATGAFATFGTGMFEAGTQDGISSEQWAGGMRHAVEAPPQLGLHSGKLSLMGARFGDDELDARFDAVAADSRVPAILGSVRIMPNDSVSKLIQGIYGVYSRSYLRAVLAVNTHLADPDEVEVGTAIRFPSVTTRDASAIASLWWLRFGEVDSLGAAYSLVRQIESYGVEARLLPLWSEAQGLRFAIVQEKPYPSRSAALLGYASLPEVAGGQAEAVRFIAPDTVFMGRMNSVARKVAQKAEN